MLSPTIFQLVSQRGIESPDDVALLAPGRASTTYGVLSAHLQSIAAWLRAHDVHRAGQGRSRRREFGPEAASAFPRNRVGGRLRAAQPFVSGGRARLLRPRRRGARSARRLCGRYARTRRCAPPRSRRARAAVPTRIDRQASSVFKVRSVASTSNWRIRPRRHSSCTRPGRPHGRRSSRSRTGHLVASAPQRRRDARLRPGRPVPERYAAVSHPRSRRRAAWPRFAPEGGSAACTPGFHQLRFFEWMPRARPRRGPPRCRRCTRRFSERVRREPALLERHPFRFLRSSSAALPAPAILDGPRGDCSRVPVVEAYGMTEAAHQMASNPLPPGATQAGFGGPLRPGRRSRSSTPTADRLPGRTMSARSRSRGENVFDGYEANAEANAQRSRTAGSGPATRGRLDDDRVSRPAREAEGDHQPCRREGLAARRSTKSFSATRPSQKPLRFAMPDERLGEEVAAAVVRTLTSEAVAARRPAGLRGADRGTVQGAPADHAGRRDPEGPNGKAATRRRSPERLDPAARSRFTRPGDQAHLSRIRVCARSGPDVLQLPCARCRWRTSSRSAVTRFSRAEAVARVRELLGKPEHARS